jgi:hypothetical protein
MSIRTMPAILATAMFIALGFPSANAQPKAQSPQALHLYVLDCGIITPPNVDNYGFKPNEVADTRMITPCFLIVHPRGTLMWDTGEIPDSAFKDGVSPQKLNNYTVDRPLLPQLAAIGYTPADITYLALSHSMAITSPTPASSPNPPGSCRRATATRSLPRGRQEAACRTRSFSRASPKAKRFC